MWVSTTGRRELHPVLLAILTIFVSAIFWGIAIVAYERLKEGGGGGWPIDGGDGGDGG